MADWTDADLKRVGWTWDQIRQLREQEKNMCNTRTHGMQIEAPLPFEAKRGEVWFLKGRPYVVAATNMKYMDTNGDPDTMYVALRAKDSKPSDPEAERWIITRKAFMEKATREEPIKDVFVTPRQILDGEPCADGVVALGAVLGVSKWTDQTWKAGVAIGSKGILDEAYKVSDLYTWYRHGLGSNPDDSYLKFIAVTLGLIPRQIGRGPDRATLKRLLGIKE